MLSLLQTKWFGSSFDAVPFLPFSDPIFLWTGAEGNDVFFSNYRLYLTAALYDSKGNLLDQPLNNPGAQVPIRADYITYTITRVLTDGYWGEP